MTGVVSDDRHFVQPGCPMETELYPLAGQAEIILGDVNGERSAVRLVFEDVDTAHRVMEAARHARNVLACYLYGDEAEEAAEPNVGKVPADPEVAEWFHGEETDETAEPTVDEPSRDRSQPADSPTRKVVRHLTSV